MKILSWFVLRNDKNIREVLVSKRDVLLLSLYAL